MTALTEQRPVRRDGVAALLVDGVGCVSPPYAGGAPHDPADLHVWSLPLRTRFRGLTVRDGVLLRGDAGWGEFSPFWDYDADESAAWWRAALEAADEGWPAPVRHPDPGQRRPCPPSTPRPPTGSCAASGGCRTAKVKVAEPGQSLADEIARLEAVRDALGPGGAIRVDANAAWDVDTAVSRLVAARPRGRRPRVRGAAGARRSRTSPRCAAARTCRSPPTSRSAAPQDPFAVARAHAADIVVLKVQPLGGVRACLELAERIGLPVVVSSALETSVGLAAGVALAAALPGAAVRVRARHRAAVHLRRRRPTRCSRSTARSTVRRTAPDPRAARGRRGAPRRSTDRWRARVAAVRARA